MISLSEYSALTDPVLAQQAPADPQAFAELYRRHATSVFRYHVAHTGSHSDAEDLTSQTFIAALEGIRSYRGTGSYVAWLMGIAARKRALFFRGKRPEVGLSKLPDLPSPGPSTDEAAGHRIQLDEILQGLRNLSPDRAEALILCFFSGLDPAEVGRVMGRSPAAVKMLISRGLRDLRTRTAFAMEMDHE